MAYSPRDSDDPAVHHARLMGSGSDLESRCGLALRERALLHRSVYSRRTHDVPSLEGLRVERDSVGRLARLDTTAWKEGSVLLDESPPCTSLDLALGALRIFRHDNAAIMAGLELARLGRWRDSWQLLDQVTVHSSSSFQASCAWEAKGFLHLRRKEPSQAASAFRSAADVESDRPAPLCAWFVLGSSSGDLRQVEESASRLREMIDEADPSVEKCITFFSTLRQEGLFEPQMKTASAMANSPATQRIVHELS